MAPNKEIEIKFTIESIRALSQRLRESGFRLLTPRTHEMNTLYDLPGASLANSGQILRLRKYGDTWLLTHKAKGKEGRHKTREETQTEIADGVQMDSILRALGYSPSFRYEKFRAEWSDGKGHVVVDQTPIGDFGEIEGPSRWIDTTARLLRIDPKDYMTQNYAGLFFEWKKRARSSAKEMTFKAVPKSASR